MGAREGRAADRVGIFISFFFFAFWHAWKSKTVFLIRERVQSTMRRITTPKRGQKEVIQAQSIFFFQKWGARRLISLFFFSSE